MFNTRDEIAKPVVWDLRLASEFIYITVSFFQAPNSQLRFRQQKSNDSAAIPIVRNIEGNVKALDNYAFVTPHDSILVEWLPYSTQSTLSIAWEYVAVNSVHSDSSFYLAEFV